MVFENNNYDYLLTILVLIEKSNVSLVVGPLTDTNIRVFEAASRQY